MSFLGIENRALQKEGEEHRKRQQPVEESRGRSEDKSNVEKSLEEDPLTFCGKAIQGTTLKADNEKALDNLKELARIFGDEKAIDPFEQAFLKDDMFIEMERQRDRVISGG